jgi:hypothetical protein
MFNDFEKTIDSVDVAESSMNCSAEADDLTLNQMKQIEGRKRARSCSHDTFLELERFLKLHGLDCNNKTGRYHTHESNGEEGTDMSFLALPSCMEQDHDLAAQVATASLHSYLETEQ